MEERKGAYNEDGEYVMTDEEALSEIKKLKPLMQKLNNDEIDAIFYVDEINDHLKKLEPYYKSKGRTVRFINLPPEGRKDLEIKAIIAKERQERDEAWLKMTDEEKLRNYEKTVEEASKFAEKMGMNIYELKDKDE